MHKKGDVNNVKNRTTRRDGVDLDDAIDATARWVDSTTADGNALPASKELRGIERPVAYRADQVAVETTSRTSPSVRIRRHSRPRAEG